MKKLVVLVLFLLSLDCFAAAKICFIGLAPEPKFMEETLRLVEEDLGAKFTSFKKTVDIKKGVEAISECLKSRTYEEVLLAAHSKQSPNGKRYLVYPQALSAEGVLWGVIPDSLFKNVSEVPSVQRLTVLTCMSNQVQPQYYGMQSLGLRFPISVEFAPGDIAEAGSNGRTEYKTSVKKVAEELVEAYKRLGN